jgi:hypothetical protein
MAAAVAISLLARRLRRHILDLHEQFAQAPAAGWTLRRVPTGERGAGVGLVPRPAGGGVRPIEGAAGVVNVRPAFPPWCQPGLLVEETLLRAIRCESALALRYWCGVSRSTVERWPGADTGAVCRRPLYRNGRPMNCTSREDARAIARLPVKTARVREKGTWSAHRIHLQSSGRSSEWHWNRSLRGGGGDLASVGPS